MARATDETLGDYITRMGRLTAELHARERRLLVAYLTATGIALAFALAVLVFVHVGNY
jgi:hypothetical protein